MKHIDEPEIKSDHFIVRVMKRGWYTDKFCGEGACIIPTRIHGELGEENTRKCGHLKHTQEGYNSHHQVGHMTRWIHVTITDREDSLDHKVEII